MAKLNKKNTEDLFSGLKYVDKLLNEAAGVGNPPKKLSFEEKMKLKLKEGYEEAADLTEGELDEYSELQPNHISGGVGSVKKPHTGKELDELDEFNEFNDEEFFGDEAEETDGLFGDSDFGDEIEDITKFGKAAKYAANDMADEFEMDSEEEFEPEEEEMDEEFDFTEDIDLMESLMESEPGMDTPDDETIPSDVEGATPIEATPTDEMPGEETAGDVDMTTDAGLGTEDDVDMGADVEGGEGEETSMGSPSMGGGAGAPSPSGMEEPAEDMATSPVNGGEDIDQLIADLVSSPEEAEQPAVFGENAHKDLGFTNLKDEDINSNKVKMENKKKSVKEAEIKMTKLGDVEITGNVKGATTTGKVATHSGTGKRVDPKGEEYTALGDEDIKSNKVGKAAEKATAPSQPKFSALRKENVEKTKALYTLAEKVVTLEDEVANLKFAKFKLEKVNSVLTLLPELKLATREKLVEKFDSCKSYAETKKLYAEVADMVKDHKRGTINEAVLKNQKSTKYFTEDVDNDNSKTDSETARRNFLMGVKGFENGYGEF